MIFLNRMLGNSGRVYLRHSCIDLRLLNYLHGSLVLWRWWGRIGKLILHHGLSVVVIRISCGSLVSTLLVLVLGWVNGLRGFDSVGVAIGRVV